MAKILAFRRPEESCTNCWYFTPGRHDNRGGTSGYCRHPERTKDVHPGNHAIERLGLHCDASQWCPKYVNVDSPAMKKLQFVSGIKFMLLCMRRSLRSTARKIEEADDYRELVDQFYQENRKIMTINQYKAAKRDQGYFITVIEEAIQFYKKTSKNERLLSKD
jgi:hypothetical protein